MTACIKVTVVHVHRALTITFCQTEKFFFRIFLQPFSVYIYEIVLHFVLEMKSNRSENKMSWYHPKNPEHVILGHAEQVSSTPVRDINTVAQLNLPWHVVCPDIAGTTVHEPVMVGHLLVWG